MTGRLRISRTGLELIKSFEGFRDTALRLPDGRWTVGFGHVRSAREGVTISEKDAEDLLLFDLKPTEDSIRNQVLTPLNQNQYDALVSLVFNISPGQFRDSAILRALNVGDVLGAANGFDAWRKARINGRLIVVDALVRRRTAEKALFLEHPEGRATAPTPMVTPELDQSGFGPVANDREIPADASHANDPAPVGGLRPAVTVSAPQSAPEPDVQRAVVDLANQQTVREAVREAARSHTQTMAAASNGMRVETIVQDVTVADIVTTLEAPAVALQVATTPKGQAQPEVNPIEEASRIAAERIARILARSDVPPTMAGEPARPNGRQSGHQAEAPKPAAQTVKAAPQARAIPDDLPDFNAPKMDMGKARIIIDDTEEYDPGFDPRTLLNTSPVTGRRDSPRVAVATERPDGGRMSAAAPWIATLVMSAPLFGVGVVDLMQGPGEHPWAPMMTSAFGLLVLASLYYIATRAGRRD
jgi:GH24 family phage-related lysozyme (muramidase)